MNVPLQFRISPLMPRTGRRLVNRLIAGSIVLIVFVLGSTAVLGEDPGIDWWFSAPSDATWDKKPLNDIRAAAEQGDAAGQYYLGRSYFFGQGGKRDLTESFRWI